jgi:hypothetical protein
MALSKMPKTECSFHLHAERLLHIYCKELPIILHEYDKYHKEFSTKIASLSIISSANKYISFVYSVLKH